MKHPRKRDADGRPLPVTKLTTYQYDFWKYPGKVLAVKSNKIGLTTSALIECFQKAILPEGAGTQIIIGGQDQNHANTHLRDLKLMIRDSKKYSEYLITEPHRELLREMKSKMSVAYIENPYNKNKPSEIIALGQSPGRTYAWKNVSHILMSDISKMARKDWENYWRGMYTRIANTNGTIKIESVPSGKQGLIWQMYKQLTTGHGEAETDTERETFVDDTERLMPSFKLMIIPYHAALEAGVISQDYLDDYKRDQGELSFRQAHECEFLGDGNQWYQDTDFIEESYSIE